MTVLQQITPRFAITPSNNETQEITVLRGRLGVDCGNVPAQRRHPQEQRHKEMYSNWFAFESLTVSEMTK
jgi:hypothetical protein